MSLLALSKRNGLNLFELSIITEYLAEVLPTKLKVETKLF